MKARVVCVYLFDFPLSLSGKVHIIISRVLDQLWDKVEQSWYPVKVDHERGGGTNQSHFGKRRQGEASKDYFKVFIQHTKVAMRIPMYGISD